MLKYIKYFFILYYYIIFVILIKNENVMIEMNVLWMIMGCYYTLFFILVFNSAFKGIVIEISYFEVSVCNWLYRVQ